MGQSENVRIGARYGCSAQCSIVAAICRRPEGGGGTLYDCEEGMPCAEAPFDAFVVEQPINGRTLSSATWRLQNTKFTWPK